MNIITSFAYIEKKTSLVQFAKRQMNAQNVCALNLC